MLSLVLSFFLSLNCEAKTAKHVRPATTPATAAESADHPPDIVALFNLRREDLPPGTKQEKYGEGSYGIEFESWHMQRKIKVSFYQGEWHVDHISVYGDYPQVNELHYSGSLMDCNSIKQNSIIRIYCGRDRDTPRPVVRGILWPYGEVREMVALEDHVCVMSNTHVACWSGTYDSPTASFAIKPGRKGDWIVNYANNSTTATPPGTDVCISWTDGGLTCWPLQGAPALAQPVNYDFNHLDEMSYTNEVCYPPTVGTRYPVPAWICGTFDSTVNTRNHFRTNSIHVEREDVAKLKHIEDLTSSVHCSSDNGYFCWGEGEGWPLFSILDYAYQNFKVKQMSLGAESACLIASGIAGCIVYDSTHTGLRFVSGINPKSTGEKVLNLGHYFAVQEGSNIRVYSALANDAPALKLGEDYYFREHKLLSMARGEAADELCVTDQIGDLVRTSCAHISAMEWKPDRVSIERPSLDQFANVQSLGFFSCGDFQDRQTCWTSDASEAAKLFLVTMRKNIRFMVAKRSGATPHGCISNGEVTYCDEDESIHSTPGLYSLFRIEGAYCAGYDKNFDCWGSTTSHDLDRFMPTKMEMGISLLETISNPAKTRFYAEVVDYLSHTVDLSDSAARVHVLKRIFQVVDSPDKSQFEADYANEISVALKRSSTFSQSSQASEVRASVKLIQASLSLLVNSTSETESKILATNLPLLGHAFANPSPDQIVAVVNQLDQSHVALQNMLSVPRLFPFAQLISTEREWLNTIVR